MVDKNNRKDNLNEVKMIFLETITACNLKCSYCPNSIYDNGSLKNMKKMDIKLFNKIIDELAEIGWKGRIQPHRYGEPLLDDRLLNLIKNVKIKLPESEMVLFTNGELMRLDLYQDLIKAGVDSFIITQHLPKQHKGILKILDYRKKYGDDGIFLKYGKLHTATNWGGLVEINEERKISNCRWPSYNVGISYKGEVVVCCYDYFNTIKVGNVNNERIIDIWKKPNYIKLRTDIKKGIYKHNLCKKCRIGTVKK